MKSSSQETLYIGNYNVYPGEFFGSLFWASQHNPDMINSNSLQRRISGVSISFYYGSRLNPEVCPCFQFLITQSSQNLNAYVYYFLSVALNGKYHWYLLFASTTSFAFSLTTEQSIIPLDNILQQISLISICQIFTNLVPNVPYSFISFNIQKSFHCAIPFCCALSRR